MKDHSLDWGKHSNECQAQKTYMFLWQNATYFVFAKLIMIIIRLILLDKQLKYFFKSPFLICFIHRTKWKLCLGMLQNLLCNYNIWRIQVPSPLNCLATAPCNWGQKWTRIHLLMYVSKELSVMILGPFIIWMEFLQ